jgi:hypothetical protein
VVKIEQLPDITAKAIRANFAKRNTRVADGRQQARMVAERRRQLREWIAVARVLRNPSCRPYVVARLLDSGPLMTHDLRNRVILAGYEELLARNSTAPGAGSREH